MTHDCPFCGSRNLTIADLSFEQGYSVLCLDCSAGGPQADSAEEAINLWMNRHDAGDFVKLPPLDSEKH